MISATTRVGEIRRAKNGLMMTIVAYRSSTDIDVQFEDGQTVTNRAYANFIKGAIGHPNADHYGTLRNSHIGEVSTAKNGQKMTLIAYHSSRNVDVRFEDDTIVTRRAYCNFRSGDIKNPKFAKTQLLSRVGTKIIAKNGMEMEIIAYRGSLDVDVKFADGYIKHHVQYVTFLHGEVLNPNIQLSNGKQSLATARVGLKKLANNGMEMEIIAYRGANDIDVRFEDDTVVEHTKWSSFKLGQIRNPQLFNKKCQSFIGRQNRTLRGDTMTIITYRRCDDIDVRFDDGYVMPHISYEKFKSGSLLRPDQRPTVRNIGKRNFNNVGIKMEITDYKTNENVTVIFETGYECSSKRLSAFNKGGIAHPFPYVINTVSMDKLAYIHEGVGNFYCHCTKCNMKDIMTITEMREHICQ